MVFFLILGVVALLVLVGIYNGLVTRRNAVRNGFAAIDVQLKKRWNLIPQLVATVKGYAAHEQELLEAVTEARRANAGSGERLRAESQVGAQMGRLLMVAEGYPELQSSGQFLHLQRNLTEIESQIAAARRAYNAAVRANNDGIETFPGNVFAKAFGFETADWFEVLQEEREAVEVDFS